MEVISYDNKGNMSSNLHPQHPAGSDPRQHINISNKQSSSASRIETFVPNSNIPQFPGLPLFTPPIAAPTDEVVKETRRFKLSRDQTVALERLYHQCPKPNQETKRELATAINLSPTRVNIWFQNRRHRAKVNKRAQEAKMTQILETAGRERIAKMAMGPPGAPSDCSSEIETPTSATSSQSALPLLTTEFSPVPSGTNSPNYTSPKEAAAASLARSLAIASAYASTFSPSEDGTIQEYHPPVGLYDGSVPENFSLDPYESNFYPVSTFSDWGSSYYTPTPAGQQTDPFEFDKLACMNTSYNNTPLSNGLSAVAPAFQDDYSAFAAAAQMNTMPKTMNMTLKARVPVPPALVLKNNNSSKRPALPRVATCPDLSNIDDMPMQASHTPTQTASETSSPITENMPKSQGTVKMERSQSYNDRPSLQQEMALRRLRPAPPSNNNARTNRIFHGKVSVPQSPLRSGQTAGDEFFLRPNDGAVDKPTPLLTPPSDSDFATAAMRHKLKRKPSDLSKEHSPDLPDLESDSGITTDDTPVKRTLASPPPTPEVTGLAQGAQGQLHDDSEYTSFTQMLENSSPIVAHSGFTQQDHKGFQTSVENWVNMGNMPHQYQQTYWTPGHVQHPSVDTHIAYEFSNLDIPQQSSLAYGMQNGHHHQQ